jgi:hypothetical protein
VTGGFPEASPRLAHTTPRATPPAPPRRDAEPRASPRAGAMDLSGAPARLCVSNPTPVRSARGGPPRFQTPDRAPGGIGTARPCPAAARH